MLEANTTENCQSTRQTPTKKIMTAIRLSALLQFNIELIRADSIVFCYPKNLHPAVVGITNIKYFTIFDEYSGRHPELPESQAPLAESEKKSALTVEELDVIEKAVDNVDHPVPVRRNSLWHRNVTGAVAMMTEQTDETSSFVEELDPEIHGVRNIQNARGRIEYVSGIIEFAFLLPSAPE
jgi:hypothetical protein